MCGIFAAFERTSPVDMERVARAVKAMAHRGPDAQATISVAASNGINANSAAVGHARLAILDLDKRSDQPFRKSGAVTVFNGEIFNFHEVREKKLNHVGFVTTSDTEVLHELVRLTGLSQMQALIGQWAFVQIDETSGIVTLGRDRYGKKPLFYYKDEHRLVVASTIRAIATYLNIQPAMNQDYIRSFVAYGSAPLKDEETPYDQISQMPPGQHATFDPVAWTFTSTFSLCGHPVDGIDPAPNGTGSHSLEQTLISAARLRLLSDRPVGLLLSGGVDSTLIATILHSLGLLDEVTCFIGDTGNSDDARYAKIVAGQLNAKVNVIPIKYDGLAFDSFRKICWHQERPFELVGNLMAMPQLYEAISATPIKVVIDGTGADEVFGGYWDRQFPFALRQAALEGQWSWIARNAFANKGELRRYLVAARSAMRGSAVFHDPTYEVLASEPVSAVRCRDEMLTMERDFAKALSWDALNGRLQDWLWQNDRNAMAYSLEARSPFLDARLMPWMSTGYDKKFVGRYNKFELRSMFEKFTAVETQWRVQKQGFRWSASRFLSENKNQVFELIRGSELLSRLYPKLPGFLDQALAGRLPIHSRVEQRLLSVAGVEEAMHQ